MICQNCAKEDEKVYKYDSKLFKSNIRGIREGQINVCSVCKNYFETRKEKLETITSSKDPHRLIVAGPGTGKTYAFQKVIDSIIGSKKVLIFTLINNLADDLRNDFSEDKYKDVEVKTFHGYCLGLLRSKLGVDSKYYSDLPKLVSSDAEYLKKPYTIKSIRSCIVNLEDASPIMKFYFNRTNYYEAIGPDDTVYKVYKYYLSNADKIPNYDLVIADEYQDFNKLEASFIALLATKNRTLVAGDDDQAVYGFRFASTEYIRGLFNNTVYKHFNLPYSTRCTEVMVNAVNNFISQVQNQGHLSGRISEKEYKSYWPDKYMLNDKYPNIPVIDCTSHETAVAYVKDHILKITADEDLNGEETDTQFLVIGAESGHRLKSLEEYLTKNLDSEVYEVIPAKSSDAPNDINEGYRLLYANPTSNLGWRIVLEYDSVTNIAGIIKETYETGTVLHPLLPDEYKRKHIEKANEIFRAGGNSTEATLVVNKPRVKVKLVNSLGSKGLSALHVIIYEFHNKVLPRNVDNIEDDDICRCLVAMTRAKNSCVFLAFKEFNRTSGRSENMRSIFLKMLPQDLLGSKKYRIQHGKLTEI